MRIGVHLPQWGRDANRASVIAVAKAVEDVGLDSVWVADHIVIPLESSTAYPYRSRGVPFEPSDGFLEALTTLAVIAGATERIRLGTSVLVMPMREPLLTAKTIATLDVLSEGRVVLALGAGWWEEEFRALGQPFSRRGARFDEQIQLLRALWRDGRAEHSGEFYSFGDIACLPLPVQIGGPPILIGGMTAAARRRAVTLGDGWHAIGADVDALATGREELTELAASAARSLDDFELSTSTGLPADAERALERLTALCDAGFTNVVLNVAAESPRALVAAVERLATEVMPMLKASGSPRRRIQRR